MVDCLFLAARWPTYARHCALRLLQERHLAGRVLTLAEAGEFSAWHRLRLVAACGGTAQDWMDRRLVWLGDCRYLALPEPEVFFGTSPLSPPAWTAHQAFCRALDQLARSSLTVSRCTLEELPQLVLTPHTCLDVVLGPEWPELRLGPAVGEPPLQLTVEEGRLLQAFLRLWKPRLKEIRDGAGKIRTGAADA